VADRDHDATTSGARRALPGEGTGMSGVEVLAEQLAVAVKALELIGEHARLDLSERGIAEAERYALLARDALDALQGAA
jgi:hypothetical protein